MTVSDLIITSLTDYDKITIYSRKSERVGTFHRLRDIPEALQESQVSLWDITYISDFTSLLTLWCDTDGNSVER